MDQKEVARTLRAIEVQLQQLQRTTARARRSVSLDHGNHATMACKLLCSRIEALGNCAPALQRAIHDT